MARLARVVAPGYPYHVTHRGNRRDGVLGTAHGTAQGGVPGGVPRTSYGGANINYGGHWKGFGYSPPVLGWGKGMQLNCQEVNCKCLHSEPF